MTEWGGYVIMSSIFTQLVGKKFDCTFIYNVECEIY